jgi:hypothetical protein
MIKKTTIDEVHREKLDQFFVQTKQIPELLREKEELQQKIAILKKENKTEEWMEIKDKIQTIKEQIRHYNNEKKQYFLKNSKDIFHYFEEKQKISQGNNRQNKSMVNQFFGLKEEAEEDDATKFSQFKSKYGSFWKNINRDTITSDTIYYSVDICDSCKKGEMVHQEEEGILICNNTQCGKFVSHIIDSSKPNNKEPPNEVSYTAYIRLNHFKEIVSQFQAKKSTQIPAKIIDAIKQRIIKERIKKEEINYAIMRDILRKLGFNKYFEHIQYIISLFGIQPPIMDDKLIETLYMLFIEIQQPWSICCPPDRVNFFNYTYILYQLCVLLDQKQYLPYIQLLKDPAKQKEQDKICQKVFKLLDWEFTPTV